MFHASDWKGRVDCIHAGFPCQPHSVAGKCKGADDDRNLWPATTRVIGEIRPEWCFLENVPGLISNGFIGTVLGDLARLGYDARWTVLGADQVGATHRRDRWWCLAHAKHGGIQVGRGIGNLSEVSEVASGILANVESRHKDQTGEILANTNDAGRGEQRKSEPNETPLKTIERSSWLGIEPDLGRNSDGLAGRLDGIEEEYCAKTENSFREAVRHMRESDGAKAIQRAIRGLSSFQAEAALFAFLREYERGGRIPRSIMESPSTPREILRKMRKNRVSRGAPHGRRSLEQYAKEYPNALRELSCLVASRSETPWDSPLWESGINRVTNHGTVASRVDRLKALGNGQVPLQAAVAWEILMGS
jgi:site-specific DNA-cytosine methylase